jgi:hypothetical protein
LGSYNPQHFQTTSLSCRDSESFLTRPRQVVFKSSESAGFSLFRFRSPLLTESLSISFPPVTEMFHFAGCRDVRAMDSHELEQVLSRSGYPIRKFTGQSVFAALRDLSQLATSFIAYWHQGIHDALFVA